MTAAEFIEELEHLGVKLTPEGDQLRYRGPAMVITPELKLRIVENKTQIIATLTQCEEGCTFQQTTAETGATLRSEYLELLGELTYLFNERASILEYDGRLSRDEAEEKAMIETRATPQFRRCQTLGRLRRA